MNIYIATYGSRGDVQPYVALGKGLLAAGHRVTLATSVRFKAFVQGHGLDYGYMNDHLLGILDTDQGRDLVENTASLFDVVCHSIRMKPQLASMQATLLKESWEAAQASEPDLILFHPKAYGGLHFAEKLRIPAVLALPFPMLVPSGTRPHIGFPDPGLGPAYNRATYSLVRALMALSARSQVNAWRKSAGLPPVRQFDLLRRDSGRPVPVLHGFSPAVAPPPPDWPSSVTTTGFWFLDPDQGWAPSPALDAFLRAGPAPVYIGFGSMAGHRPARLADLVVRALEKVRARGILATGWGGLDPQRLPETIFQIDQAPHHRLFPRTAAVVHHGGAGTTAAGLRAGRPSVIVPFFGDQPFWAEQVRRLGAGPDPIPRALLTADTLARAVARALYSTEIRQAARRTADCLARENGIDRAVKRIETISAKGEI